jgi:hypothetical protein
MKDIINCEKALYDHIDYLRKQFDKHKYLRVDVKSGKQRTNLQNASLHLYCQQVADTLNDNGITFTAFFRAGFEVPWTMEIVKENIWRPVQLAVCGKESTTKPYTGEYQQIFEPINLKLANWGIHVPWPRKKNK